jgi:glycosyltransferase involved in cell wall biosynthesis
MERAAHRARMSTGFRGRLGLQQRVLPDYRVPFFDMLAEACIGGMSIFAGHPRSSEAITEGRPHAAQFVRAANIHILGGPLYFCRQQGFIAWLEAWDPDALIVEANPRYLATYSAVRWMHGKRRSVIGWGLGAPELAGSLVTIRRSRRSDFLRQFDALVAYSQRGAQEYARAGFAEDRIFVATNAVASRPTSALAHRPIDNGGRTVLFVGRLQPRKRVDALLRACGELAAPQPRLVIVGDGPERGRLETLAREIYPAAEFTGALRGEGLRRKFQEADLFVLPGTGGLAVQEAMANGLPVLVARGDGTQDDLVREGNGWQIQPDDYPALVRSLRDALSDSARLRKMGEESYRIVREEVNIESMVEVFLEALSSLH